MLIIVLSLAGLLISGYLTQRHYALSEGVSLAPSFCTVNATIDCDRVLLSQYAVVFGYPLSSIGFAFYLVILWLAVAVGFLDSQLSLEIRREAVSWIVALTLLALVIDVYLLGVLIFALGAVCLMCVATYLINGLT
ncbi:MAG: vitamin K epoxide reductase family protein, partial [Gammaproteobacteria bacterium]|nr:vitamin K epoxide reductase family protein [Gammaproteobacteria bacterium]